MTRLDARCGGLLQRLSTALLTEFVSVCGKFWIGAFPTAKHLHGILPTGSGSVAVYRLDSGLVLSVLRSSSLVSQSINHGTVAFVDRTFSSMRGSRKIRNFVRQVSHGTLTIYRPISNYVILNWTQSKNVDLNNFKFHY